MVTAIRLYRADLIKQFLTQDELWERIAEYGQTVDMFVPVIDDSIHWVGLFDDKRLFGIIFLHPHNSTTMIAHINIQKKDRYKLSRAGGIVGLEYIIENTDYDKVQTETPVIYPNVMKFVESMGFRKEGISRKSINKNTQLVDQVMYGATRQEIIEFLSKDK